MTQSTAAGPVPIETLATQIEQRFPGLELEIPKALGGTTVTSYSADPTGANYSLRIDDFPVDQDHQAKLDVTLAITGSSGDYAGTFGGTMPLAGLPLDLHFADESASLTACVLASASTPLDTGALMSALGLPSALAAPLGLGAEAEVIAIFKRAAAGTQTAYQKLVKVSLFAGEDLTRDLPLIGRALPVLQRLTAREISLFAASKHFNDDEMEDFQELLPDGFSLPTEPPDDNAFNTMEKEQEVPENVVLPQGLDVYLTLGCGPDAVSYVYQLGGSVEGNTFWFPVKKQAGPLYLAELGLQVDGDGLGLRLLASLTTGPLTLSLIGFGFKTHWSHLSLELEPPYGAGLVLKDGSVEIGGALEILPKDARPADVDFELLGDLVLKDSKISIGAMGSYAKLADADPSLFVFVDMFVPPEDPVIAITGVMGGFGYNSDILIPDQLTAISSWPFLKWLKDQQMDKQKPSGQQDGAQALPRPTVLHAAPEPEPGPEPEPVPPPAPAPVPPPAPPPAKPSPVLPSTSPLAVLQLLQSSEPPWVTPRAGNIWLALGLQLTIVELVRCTGLLTVEFGNDLIISYMGMGTARYPQSGAVEFAYLELETEILLKPEDGYVSYMGLLSPNSFVLDQACTLSGGFALCLWYGPSPHAGDFVFSAGGYHPLYQKPAWYPAVPRLMFDWHVGGGVTIKGSSYATLVSRAIMAGGELDLLFHAGPVRAWFKAHADFLIEWKPFWYAASIGIDLGASLHVHIWFIHFTIKIELGADLDIWGPDTGGKVRFHILFVSVTIHFGARSGDSLPPATWAEFAGLLHAQPFNIQATAGLLKAPPTSVDGGGRAQRSTWVLRPSGAQIIVATSVPCTAINGGATGLDTLDIRPMQLTGLASPLTISLEIDDDENGWTPVQPAQDGWTCTQIRKSVPTALWGTPVTKSAELLDGPGQLTAAVGLTLTAPDAELSPHSEQADLANYSYAFLDSCALPLAPEAPAAGAAAKLGNAVEVIAETLQANAAARQTLFDDLGKLGLDPGSNDHMSTFVADIGSLFTGEPMLC